MQKMQPEDEWTFLGIDDFIDDGQIDDIDKTMETSAEESAMHIERPDRPRRPSTDPASSDSGVNVEDEGRAEVARFDDEEPEFGEQPLDTSEHEPEIVEILESQNFLFGDDTTDDDVADDASD